VRKIAIDHSSYNMKPMKVGAPGQYVRVTRHVGRRKERDVSKRRFWLRILKTRWILKERKKT
jgi:hypothetical protein